MKKGAACVYTHMYAWCVPYRASYLPLDALNRTTFPSNHPSPGQNVCNTAPSRLSAESAANDFLLFGVAWSEEEVGGGDGESTQRAGDLRVRAGDFLAIVSLTVTKTHPDMAGPNLKFESLLSYKYFNRV